MKNDKLKKQRKRFKSVKMEQNEWEKLNIHSFSHSQHFSSGKPFSDVIHAKREILFDSLSVPFQQKKKTNLSLSFRWNGKQRKKIKFAALFNQYFCGFKFIFPSEERTNNWNAIDGY